MQMTNETHSQHLADSVPFVRGFMLAAEQSQASLPQTIEFAITVKCPNIECSITRTLIGLGLTGYCASVDSRIVGLNSLLSATKACVLFESLQDAHMNSNLPLFGAERNGIEDAARYAIAHLDLPQYAAESLAFRALVALAASASMDALHRLGREHDPRPVIGSLLMENGIHRI